MQDGKTAAYHNELAGSFDAALSHDIIAVKELYAICRFVDDVLAQRPDDLRLIIVATDNRNAKMWMERKCAHHRLVNMMLARTITALESTGVRLYVTYVRSAENVADDPSRERTLDAGKVTTTARRLDQGRVDAYRSSFEVEGNIVGGSKE
jgi:hypothetical protein